MNTSRRAWLWALACVLGSWACSKKTPPAPPERTVSVVVTTDAPGVVRLDTLAWTPRGIERLVERGPHRVELKLLSDGVKDFELSAEGACKERPVLTNETTLHIKLKPLFTVAGGQQLTQLGYDTPFTLMVDSGCDETKQGPILWRIEQGANLNLNISQNGRLVSGRTPTLESLHGPVGAPGLLTASPRTSARTVLSATWDDGKRKLTQVFILAAQTRQSGLPSLARGHRVWLAGAWKVAERPKGSRAESTSADAYSALLPDALGRWLLNGPNNTSLELNVGVHGEGLLDCGRADCHREIAQHALKSPMTTVFQRGITAKLGSYNTACVSGCHTTGELGVDDGGYDSVLGSFGLHATLPQGPDAFHQLPRDLRRVSGVTCTGCHGPGAIPAPTAAWAILRSDVCATCHDFPPRYEHVVRYATTRMARSPSRPALRRAPCNGCHTTSGFLTRIGASSKERTAPDEFQHGLSCQTCHAAHAAETDQHLLRRPRLPDGFPSVKPDTPGLRLCVSCHSAEASGSGQATLLYASTDKAAAPHSGLSCTDCHGARESDPRGASHDFVVRTSVCLRCHEPPAIEKHTDKGRIADRAAALWKKRVRLPLPTPQRPAHALALSQEARLLSLILDDHGAAAHNAPYARALLDALENELPFP